jgi:nitroreductase
VAEADRSVWQALIPSLTLVTGGAILWVIVGDGERVEAKYGSRGYRFLLLEAGHLMQNLCLLSASLELSTLPLGGFLEPDIARHLQLPKSDAVLYAGISGAVP